MKKRLIALLIILCMVLSAIPVYAEDSAAGTLTLGQEVDVESLAPGEERLYTFEAQGDTRYYFYLLPDANSSELPPITIDPRGTNEDMHATAYEYSGYEGTMFICENADTMRFLLENTGEYTASFRVGVAEMTQGTATSMTLNMDSYTAVIGQDIPLLQPRFEPAFSYEENVEFTVDDPEVVGFGDYMAGKELILQGVGTATVTATCGSMTATCTINVVAPANPVDITSGTATVTVSEGASSEQHISFTAPADANTVDYVVYCPAMDDLSLTPAGFGADNIQTPDNELVHLSNLIPGKTYYLKMSYFGQQTEDIAVSLAKCVAPTDVQIIGFETIEVGFPFDMQVVFPTAEEYTPVIWSVEDPSVLVIRECGNFTAILESVGAGKTNVIAEVPGTDISAVYEVEVVDNNAGPQQPDRKSVELDANDGGFTISDGVDTQTGIPNIELDVEAGKCLRDYGVTITDPAFWTNRAFDGWEVWEAYPVYDDDGNFIHFDEMLLEDEGLLQTNELLDYSIPADTYLKFRIKWGGDDSDYYFDLYFETMGGQMTVTDDNNNDITDGRGERIRKDGTATLADALLWDITVDPVHPEHGTFEGWLTFEENADGEMVLGSTATVSTADIFAAAPAYNNVIYVAKWSSLTMEDYDGMFSGGGGGTDLPIDTYEIYYDQWNDVYANPDGYAKVQFTPTEDGLYMLGHNADWYGVLVEDVDPVITKKYDHDIMVDGMPFCGPVYDLDKGVTYTFTVRMDGSHQTFLLYKNVEATDISAPEMEITGFVGSYVELYYTTTPVDGFSGVNDSVSSDPTVAKDVGGANWDCSRVIELYKVGTANITVTLANGKSVTVKVNAVEPPEFELGSTETATLKSMKHTIWKFTAPQTGVYYVTADCASGEAALMPNDESQLLEYFYSGTTTGMWLDLQAGEEVKILLGNPTDETEVYTVKADLAPAVTGIVIEDQEHFVTQQAGMEVNFLPLGAYDEITGWTVSDETVVELLGQDGRYAGFSALKTGSVTVKVTTAGGITGTSTFKVREPMKLDAPETFEVKAGEWREIIFEAPKDGYYFTYHERKDDMGMGLSANDNSLHTEKIEGYWTQLSEGDYLAIWLENYGKTAASTTVEVVDASLPITSMELVAMPVTYVGTPGVVEITPEPFGACDFKDVKLADESIATIVGNDGYSLWLEALKPGTTTLTVTTEVGVSATCTIVVKEPESIVLNQSVNIALEPEQFVGYSFTAPEDGDYVVSSTGLFAFEVNTEHWGGYFKEYQPDLSLAKGEKVTLLVCTGKVAASGTVTIRKMEDTTAITLPDASGVVGHASQVMVSQTPAGSWLGDVTEWSVADPTVVKIVDTFFNGVAVEFLKEGKTTLTMTCGEKKYTSTITVTAPIVVPEDTSTPTTITPEAVDSALENAVNEAKPGETVEVVIKADAAAQEAGTTVNTVELPVASLEAVAGADAVLTVELSGATVKLDTKTLETLAQKAEGATITLSVELVETTTLTEKQQKALANKKVGAVLTAQILSDGEYIGDFEGGSVTVSIPFTPPEGKNGNSFAVYYVDDDGNMEKMKTSFANDELTFTTKHFSDYVAMEEEPEATEPEATEPETTTPPAVTPPTGDSFMLLPIMLVCVISAVAILVLFKKRKAQ